MKEAIIKLGDFMNKGLAGNNNPRNKPLLTQSTGAMIYEGLLSSVQDLTAFQMDLSYYQDPAHGGPILWPYPQLFTLSDVIVICLETIILEQEGASLIKKLDGLPSLGYGWCLLDFHNYVYLSNGATAVTRDPLTMKYAIDSTVPICMAACDFNGQVLLGGAKPMSLLPTVWW
jgi:hypothetical protein